MARTALLPWARQKYDSLRLKSYSFIWETISFIASRIIRKYAFWLSLIQKIKHKFCCQKNLCIFFWISEINQTAYFWVILCTLSDEIVWRSRFHLNIPFIFWLDFSTPWNRNGCIFNIFKLITANIFLGYCSRGSERLLASKYTEPVKKLLRVECPDGSDCPDGNTCCKFGNINGGYGCCPLPDAVCCSDREYCCPHGYICGTGGKYY